MITEVLSTLKRGKSKQVLTLYASTVLQTAVGLATSVVITRALRSEQYGHYSYLSTLFNLVLIIVSTGHFSSISMMLAQSENESNKRSILGTSLLITIMVSFVFVGIIFVFSFFQDYLFHDKLGGSIRILSLLLVLFPFYTYIDSVLTGLNHINALSVLRVLPKILYLVALLFYIHVAQLKFLSAFVLLLVTSYVVYIIQIMNLRPSFNNITTNFRYIEAENKKYGYHVYLGTLSGVATSYLCALSISYFANNRELGFFNLAVVISSPLLLLPQSVATAFFKNFADMKVIPNKLIGYTILLSVTSYIIFALLIKNIVLVMYSSEYLASVSLAYVLGAAMIFHGFGDIFNKFLCAKARGREVRNGAFITGAVNILAFAILVPVLGGTGAAIARLFLGITYLIIMLLYYKNGRLCLWNSASN